ncbi:MAG TPA: hypothetical protein VF970_11995, partial [Gemmatimonadales bacterium]
MTKRTRRVGVFGPLALLAASLVASCFNDAAGPGGTFPGYFALVPAFESDAAGIVPVDRFRLTLLRASDSSLALDTVVAIPPGTDSADLSFSVVMLTHSEQFLLRLAIIGPAGDTLFRGGPVLVTPTAGSAGTPPSVDVDVRWVGTGASAAGVRILTNDALVLSGDTVILTAEAFDSAGAGIPGTPIAWSSLDTARARVPNRATGRVVGGAQRGPAQVEARLLTGPAAVGTVQVQPLPTTIVVASGSGQTGVVGALLTQLIVVQVNAGDGLGVSGLPVSFAVTSGGGSLAASQATTDADGRAGVQWTLGPIAGSQQVRATTARLSNAQATFTATAMPGAAATLILTGIPAAVSGGTNLDVTVTARDAFGNVATGYTGTVRFTSTDPTATLPTDYTFTAGDAGMHTFTGGVRLLTGGPQTVTATDAAIPSITGSGSTTVTGTSAATLLLTGLPGSVTAGATSDIVVTAKDGAGNTVTTYTGTVRFTSTDPAAILPADYTFQAADNGTHTFTGGVALRTAGSRTLTVTDLAQGAVTGSQTATVNPAATFSFSVSGIPSPVTAGSASSVVVTALDAYGNATPGYTGTIRFTSSDGQASLPADYTFTPGDAGSRTFAGGVTLKTATIQSVVATDVNVGTIVGSQAVTVSPAIASQLAFTVEPSDVVAGGFISPAVEVTALDAFGNTATGFSGAVTLSIGTNPVGGALSGTNPVTASNGAAVFSNLAINNAGNGYTLTASAGGTSSANSTAFNVLAPGGTVLWTNAAGGNWNVPGNWSTNAVPGPTEVAEITTAGTYIVTLDVSPTIAGLTLGGGSGTQTLSASSRTLTANGPTTINASGALSLSSSTVTGSGSVVNQGTISLT